ncbi:MAG: helix-hairpin-helix domain-containing protein [Anaerolineales bacterium]|jgi:predicted flap endonuclease-1-like 5' DNA nuclease|nr:helix-hairpin-helix domain-containing protein [Anaerolineales bacterium]
MIRKSVLVPGLVFASLANRGFLTQDQPVEPANGWSGLLVALLLIIIIAILMIWQSRQTPAAAARYHLDHAEHGHTEEHEAAPVELEARSAEIPLEAPPALQPEPLMAPVELDEPEDLTKIEGIGPKINEILHQAGIRNFASLAKADPEQIKEILKQAGPRFALADPGSWPEQAGYLAAGDLEKFQALTDSLRGGRAVT